MIENETTIIVAFATGEKRVLPPFVLIHEALEANEKQWEKIRQVVKLQG